MNKDKFSGSGTFPLIFLLMAFIFLLLYSFSTSPLYLYQGFDSATFRTIGLGITQGKLPYADLFDHKGPLIFYIDALGISLIPGKWGIFLLQTIFLAVSLYLTYRTCCLVADRKTSFVSVLLLVFPLIDFIVEGNQCEEWMLPFISLSLYLSVSWLVGHSGPRHQEWRSMVYGICCAVLFFIRPNDAVASIGAIMTGVFIALLVRRAYSSAFLNAIAFFAGCAVVAVPLCMYFASEGILDEVLDGTIFYNITYSAGVTLRSLSAGMIAIPLIIVGTSIFLARRSPSAPDSGTAPGCTPVSGSGPIAGCTTVPGKSPVHGQNEIPGKGPVSGPTTVFGDRPASGNSPVCGDSPVSGQNETQGKGPISGHSGIPGNSVISGAMSFFVGKRTSDGGPTSRSIAAINFILVPYLIFTLILIGKRDYYHYLIPLIPYVAIFFSLCLSNRLKAVTATVCVLFLLGSYQQHKLMFRNFSFRGELKELYSQTDRLFSMVPEEDRNSVWNLNMYTGSGSRPYIYSLHGAFFHAGVTPGNRVFIWFHLPNFSGAERIEANAPEWVIADLNGEFSESMDYLRANYTKVAETDDSSPCHIALFRRTAESSPGYGAGPD